MLTSIVAADLENNIGKDGKLPWHISEDLKRFRYFTTGSTIIMGRKTFESLPCVLPGRKHIVLTRNKEYKVDDPNVEVHHDIKGLLFYIKARKAEDAILEKFFVIGGGEIYKVFMPYIDGIMLTLVNTVIEGADAKFPELDARMWQIIENPSDWSKDANSGLEYKFITMLFTEGAIV